MKAFHVLPLRPLPLLLLLVLTGCTLRPRPAESLPPPADPEPPAEPAPPVQPPVSIEPAIPSIRVSKRICGVEMGRTIDLSELSLPDGSRPLGLALAQDTVWLLFEPALLVGVPRDMKPPEPVAIPEFGAIEEMGDLISGPAGTAWSSLAVDRWDGSVWIVSDKVPGLWHLRPGRRPEAIRLQGTPGVSSSKTRQGGFRSVLAGRGSVWVAPACADHSIWRLGTTGKLLGTALPGAAEGCPAAELEWDWAGSLWALRPDTGELFRMGSDFGWQPAGADLAAPAPGPAGSGPVRSWFFWGAEPFGLIDDEAGGEPLLVRHAASGTETFREDCGAGNALVDVAGDERGWAVLTRQWLRIADHQRGE